jgi:hypothetical protein
MKPPRLFLLFPWLVLHAISVVRGSALTTTIGANERLCFYADVDKAGEKIGVRVHFVFGGVF